ncbi:hypothetical protein AN958_02521 [Leucoagaricus sp. SymC.cos]|nr:hypothetical protein AN958_02521 [Leucoagaricus sp. SymC.cos]
MVLGSRWPSKEPVGVSEPGRLTGLIGLSKIGIVVGNWGIEGTYSGRTGETYEKTLNRFFEICIRTSSENNHRLFDFDPLGKEVCKIIELEEVV